jgi:hypothetical protein
MRGKEKEKKKQPSSSSSNIPPTTAQYTNIFFFITGEVHFQTEFDSNWHASSAYETAARDSILGWCVHDEYL